MIIPTDFSPPPFAESRREISKCLARWRENLLRNSPMYKTFPMTLAEKVDSVAYVRRRLARDSSQKRREKKDAHSACYRHYLSNSFTLLSRVFCTPNNRIEEIIKKQAEQTMAKASISASSVDKECVCSNIRAIINLISKGLPLCLLLSWR